MDPNSTWRKVDEYVSSNLLPEDPVLNAALEANKQAGFPEHDVAPNQGKFLQFLVRMTGARNVLELGTLGGYSTIWMARGLPQGGRVITLEVDKKHGDVARVNIENAGLLDRVEIRVAPAIESLQKLAEETAGPFDFIFIDADKQNNVTYLEWSLKLSRIGTVIVVDNIVRHGGVLDANSTDEKIVGTRNLFEAIKNNDQLDATFLQTVGVKGWDGFVIAMVKQPST